MRPRSMREISDRGVTSWADEPATASNGNRRALCPTKRDFCPQNDLGRCGDLTCTSPDGFAHAFECCSSILEGRPAFGNAVPKGPVQA
jgi:hypothetical protein